MHPFAQWFEATGLVGLFLAGFLAASILPFSSEAVLAAAALGPWNSLTLLGVAAAGNWLGGLTTYGIGYFCDADTVTRWLRADPRVAEKWRTRLGGMGTWSALLTWLPFIGDGIALALGVFRVRPVAVAVLMLAGRTARYAVIIAGLRGLTS